MTTSNIPITKEYEIPATGTQRACWMSASDWEYLKTTINSIKYGWAIYEILCSVFLGAGITAVISVLLLPHSGSKLDDIAKVVYWAVAICCLILGAVCGLFAYQQDDIVKASKTAVINYMKYLENGMQANTSSLGDGNSKQAKAP